MRLFAIIVLSLATMFVGAQECRGRGGLVLDVTSTRNVTGHRQVKADIRVMESQLESKQVHSQVEQRTCTVNGTRQLQLTIVIEAPEPQTPPQGYELAPGLGWYRLYLTPRTWEEARLACEAEDAHLAVLNSPQEAEVLKGIFARAPATIPNAEFNHVASIGYTDVVEGRYLTIFGETLEDAGFSEWGSNQPNNGSGKNDKESDCGAVERTGKLNDVPCRSKMAYICESPL